MKRKSFSIFFWIFVVLAAILLFFFMRRNKEGFLTCKGRTDYTTCRREPHCPGYKSNGQRKIQYCTKETKNSDDSITYSCGC
jgi:hypothetical protein